MYIRLATNGKFSVGGDKMTVSYCLNNQLKSHWDFEISFSLIVDNELGTKNMLLYEHYF